MEGWDKRKEGGKRIEVWGNEEGGQREEKEGGI